MKKIMTVFTLAIAMLLAMSSCADPDSTTLLTDGVWDFESLTTDSEVEAIQTLIVGFEAVYNRATLTLNEDNTYIMEIPVAQETETGTWSLIGDNLLNLTADGQTLPDALTIQTLSENKLVYIQQAIDPTSETAFNATYTWTR